MGKLLGVSLLSKVLRTPVFKFFILPVVLIFFLSLIIIAPVKAATGINKQINFQGKLVDQNGLNVADGTYSIRFRIYTDPTADAANSCSGNSCVWEETQSSVSVISGIFQVALGSVTSLPGNVDFNSDSLYLGIKVSTDSEMTPRIRFTSVPYAFNAQKLDGVIATQSATGFNLQGGTSSQSTISFTTASNVLTLQPGLAAGLTIQSNGSNNLTLDSAQSVVLGDNTANPSFSFLGTGGLTVANGGNNNITLGSNAGNSTVVIQPNAGGQASLIVENQGTGDLFTASAGASTKFTISKTGAITDSVYAGNNAVLYTGTSGVVSTAISSTANQCLLSGGSSSFTPTWGACDTSPGANLWNSGSGSLYPTIPSQDLLLGGISTASAKFAVLNMNSGTPTASVAGNFIINPYTSGAQELGGNLTVGGVTGFANAIANFGGNVNNYLQVNNQNRSNGGSASTDFVATADNGTDTTNYIDLGINSSGYNDSSYTIGSADDGYLYTNGGNLTIGTQTSAKALIFHTGGTLGANERMRIDGSGYVGVNTTMPTGVLDVRGMGTNTLSGTIPVATLSGKTSFAALVVNNSGAGDLFSASNAGVPTFTISRTGQIKTSNYQLSGGVLYSDSTGLFNSVANASAHTLLHGGATPTFSAVDLSSATSDVTGTLPTGNGGTGQSTYAGGDMLYYASGTSLSRLAIGGANNCLLVNAGATAPTWGSCALGTNYWQQASLGTIEPYNLTTDLLFGSSATASANFHLYGASAFQGTNPVASIGASTAFAGLVADNKGIGDLFTASHAGIPTFTINNTGQIITSNYQLNGGVLYTDSAGKFQQVQGAAHTFLRGNGVAAPTFTAVDLSTADVTNTLGADKGGTGIATPGNGALLYGSGTSTMNSLSIGGLNTCLLSTSTAPTWGNCALGTNYWQSPSGNAISPANATTDLIFGSTASSSALFHLFGNTGSTLNPVASIGANTQAAAMVVDNRGSGDLFTASSSGLTRFTINQNGNVAVGTASANYNFELAGTTAAFNSGDSGVLTSWTQNGNNLLVNVASASAVSANGYLYQIGGHDGANITPNITAVTYARINNDGSVDKWASTSALPANRASHASVVANGYVYVLGGDSNGSPANQVFYARLNSNGSLGSWSNTTNLSNPSASASAVFANGYIYVVGGQNGPVAGTVQYAKQNPDGTLGNWNSQTILNGNNTAVANPVLAVANGFLYIIGGRANSGPSTNVWAAKINPDGTVNPAITTTPLPTGLAYSAGGVMNGNIYVIGGENSTPAPVSTVYAAQVGPNGTLGGWSTMASLPGARSGGAGVVANGYIYLLGGTSAQGKTNATATIYYASGARTQLATTLDLIGLTGDSIASASAGLGGSIYAGAIYGNDTLSINGQTALWGGASVTNGLNADNLFLSGGLSGTTPVASIAANTSFAGVVVDNKGSGDLFTASHAGVPTFTINSTGQIITSNYQVNGGILYTDTTGKFGETNVGTLGQCLTSNGGGAPLWAGCPSQLLWVSTNGALYEGNSTLDLLIGGTASSSASFHVYGASASQGTTPVASIDANTSFAGLVVNNTGKGDLFTASKSGASKFVITNSGNVGIGTTTPGYTLDVAGNIRTSTGFNGTCLAGGVTFKTATQSNCNMDVAEVYHATEDIASGDVLAIDPVSTNSAVKKAHSPYASNLLGIATTNPGIILGLDGSDVQMGGETTTYMEHADPRLPAVALSGKVPVKVTSQNGTIAPGDPLTSSIIPGVAMKATQPGTIIGKALAPYTNSDPKVVGTILVFINPGWYDPQVNVPTDGQYDLLKNADLSIFDQSSTGASGSGVAQALYTIQDGAGIAVTASEALAKATIANIQAGYVHAQALTVAGAIAAKTMTADSLRITSDNIVVGGQTLHDYIASVVREVIAGYIKQAVPAVTITTIDGLTSTSQNSGLLNQITSQQDAIASASGLLEADVDKLAAGIALLTSQTASQSAGVSASGSAVLENVASTTSVLSASTSAYSELQNSFLQGLTIDGLARLQDLSARQATISADLRVKGNGLIEGILNIVDTLTTNNLIVSKLADFFDTVVFHKEAHFEDAVVFNKDTAGFAVIKKGSDHVDVIFSKEYASIPVVSAAIVLDQLSPLPSETLDALGKRQKTLENSIAADTLLPIVTRRTTKGFRILLSKPTSEDVNFSWIAVGVNQPTTFEGPTPVISPTILISPLPTASTSGLQE